MDAGGVYASPTPDFSLQSSLTIPFVELPGGRMCLRRGVLISLKFGIYDVISPVGDRLNE